MLIVGNGPGCISKEDFRQYLSEAVHREDIIESEDEDGEDAVEMAVYFDKDGNVMAEMYVTDANSIMEGLPVPKSPYPEGEIC